MLVEKKEQIVVIFEQIVVIFKQKVAKNYKAKSYCLGFCLNSSFGDIENFEENALLNADLSR